MNEDAYIYFGPDPGGDQETRYLLVEAIGIGRLKQSSDVNGEWVLRSVAPGNYGTVPFLADDQEEAEEKAITWLRTEQEELLEELTGEESD
jgi:hypothetical protein